MPLWLIICGADILTGSYLLEREKHLVGRSKQCDIPLVHWSVSRNHAVIQFEDPVLIVRDLGSRNGTFVDGRRISDAKVTVGTLLHFGRVAAEVWDKQPDRHELIDDQIETDRSSDIDDSEVVRRIMSLPAARRRVLELLRKGLAEKKVAATLSVSSQTVHWHVKEIYRTLGVHTKPELMACLMRLTLDFQTQTLP